MDAEQESWADLLRAISQEGEADETLSGHCLLGGDEDSQGMRGHDVFNFDQMW